MDVEELEEEDIDVEDEYTNEELEEVDSELGELIEEGDDML